MMVFTRSFGPMSRGCMFSPRDAVDYAFSLERVAEAECRGVAPLGSRTTRHLTAIRLNGRKDFILLDMEWSKFVKLQAKLK